MKILYFLLYDLAKPRLVPQDHALKSKAVAIGPVNRNLFFGTIGPVTSEHAY